MFKFFRNADAAEVSAPPPETVAEVAEVAPIADETPLPNDWLSQMAKSAKIVKEGDEVPEYKAVGNAEETATEDAPVEATDEKKEEVSAAPAAKPSEEQKVEPPAIVAEQSKEPTWKEYIQKEPRAAILKELGIDEKMVNFLEHWQNGGDIKEYLKEVATDYKTMDAVELMRHQLRTEYPNATDAQFEALFEDEVLQRYKLTDDFTEAEQERGKLLLEGKVSKYRPEFEARQAEKLLPKPPEKVAVQEEVGPDPQIVEQQQVLEDSRKSVLESPYFKKVLSDNKITFGTGDEVFNFPVDANELPDILYNGEKFVQSMFKVGEGKDGKMVLEADPEHQMLVAAVAKHGKKLFTELAKHYKAIGSKKAIDPIENPSTHTTIFATLPKEQANMSDAAQLAKYGKVS